MDREKILSIIIPTYNAESFLEKCLNSFAAMKREILTKCEVVVVNDGSPDKSVNIAEKFAHKNPTVFKLINKENGGHGSAINAGVQNIVGKYFKVIDADDWVDTKELENIVNELADESADAVISGYRTFDIQTNIYTFYNVNVDDYSKQYSLGQLMEHWKNVEWGFTFHGIIYRTEFYLKRHYQLIEHVYYEDWEYATIPLCYAEKIRCIDANMYCYRIGDVKQSVSAENQVKRLGDSEKVIERLLKIGEDCVNFAMGGNEYWEKKTTMLINSFYETALLMDRNRKNGRKKAKLMYSKIRQKSPRIWKKNRRKYLVFMILNYMNISDRMYRRVLGVMKGSK